MRLRSINDIFRYLFLPTGRVSAWRTWSNSASGCLHTHTHLSSTLEVGLCLCAAHSLSAVSFSGSFRRHGQICESALLLLSTSDRIILKHCTACPCCLSASPATAHQADRGTVRLTPAAFPSFSPVSQPTKQSVSQTESALFTLHKTSREVVGMMRDNGHLVASKSTKLQYCFFPQDNNS